MSEEIATLGGGCFWCLEAVYKDLRGVNSVMSGYAAGHVANPSYKQVCSGTTGHAESVRITNLPSAERMAALDPRALDIRSAALGRYDPAAKAPPRP